MPVKMKANRLVDCEVSHVSLVKRGANRIPFRIQKKDGEMINLSTLFQKREAAPAPAVVAAIVRKGADLDLVKARLTKAGYTVDEPVEQDGVLVFQQPDAAGDVASVYKIDDDLALGLNVDIAKAFESFNMDDTTFGELLHTEGFYPTVDVAMKSMTYTIQNVMEKAESPDEAAEKISKAVDDFRSYVTALASGIPAKAFKTEAVALTDDEVKALKADVEKTKADAAAAKKAEDEKAKKAEAPKANSVERFAKSQKAEAADDEADSDDPADPETAAKDDPAPVASADDATRQVLKAVEELTAQVQKTAENVSGLSDRMTSFEERIEEAEETAQKAERAVTGTVRSTAVDDPDVRARKSGKVNGAPPLMDTAFGRPN